MAVRLSVQEQSAGPGEAACYVPDGWSRDNVRRSLMNAGFARATPAQAQGVPTVIIDPSIAGLGETLYLAGADIGETRKAVEMVLRCREGPCG